MLEKSIEYRLFTIVRTKKVCKASNMGSQVKKQIKLKQTQTPLKQGHIILVHGYQPDVVDEELSELYAIVDRVEAGIATKADCDRLRDVISTNALIQTEIQTKKMTIKRLREMIYGQRTEKTEHVKARLTSEDTNLKDTEINEAETVNEACKTDEVKEETALVKKKRKGGNGKTPALIYPSSEIKEISHPFLKAGDDCPECPKGKLYPFKPKVIVRVVGISPIQVTRYDLETLRCNACGEIFRSPAPEEIKEGKYDASVVSLIATFRYGVGLPFNRFRSFMANFHMPMPPTTQWDLVFKAYERIYPVFEELKNLASNGELIYQDDTMMKILAREDLIKKGQEERKGTYTTGIISKAGDHQIAIFLTGQKHAGENLTDLLKRRKESLSPPIQMCDASANNTKGEFETVLAHCMAHARRKFVEVSEDFPEECIYLLDIVKEVYKNDKETKGMSPPERLEYHQENSRPLMNKLHKWLVEKLEKKQVEPNSGLGKAISYILKYWEELTLFLRHPGAPLDNNVAERGLKMAILHRKNSLFYKTQRGAEAGDLFMSLIHTAELNKIKPFPYITELQRNHALVAENPEEWLPWNYKQTLASLPQ